MSGRLQVEPDASPAAGGRVSRCERDSPTFEGRLPTRVVIEGIEPDVEGGRYAAKRNVGDAVDVRATIFAEGHDHLAARLLVRRGDAEWQNVPMVPRPNDRWDATFVPDAVGSWEFTIEAWIDAFASWRWGFERKCEARQEVSSELAEGASLVTAAAERAHGEDRSWLAACAACLAEEAPSAQRSRLALDPELATRMARHPDRSSATVLGHTVHLDVERERSGFGAWYECFPRSCASEPDRHGTLQDLIARLPYIAGMGFDVVYLPPIHPIGLTHRKGRNNSLTAAPEDPGSPWAIGSQEGGHKAVHPALGTLADLDTLVKEASRLGLEIALDIAFQCSPDHPYVTAHPEWFRTRPDGSIRYAENPPKRYQDIFPFDFECAAWRELWTELRDVVLFWVERGITIFRVDNPHTKPFSFWEWLIAEVRREHPEVFFLAEAFTRPAVMRRLAKIGFSQSYTYFTWRNTKPDLTAYLTDLTQGPACDYMRGNLFANTPDILHEYLQTGGRPGFQIRLVLAATLSANYGIYGPPFELCVADAVPGTEEYLNSEKYEVRHWDLDVPESLRDLVARLNGIRRDNPAFRHDRRLQFLRIDDEQLLAYVKSTADLTNVVVVVVNLDPHHAHAGYVELPLAELGIDAAKPYQVDDLLGGARYLWHGPRNFVALDPQALPAHVFRLRRRIRTERDFDYYR